MASSSRSTSHGCRRRSATGCRTRHSAACSSPTRNSGWSSGISGWRFTRDAVASDVIGRSLFELYPEAATRGIREYYEGALDGAVTVLSHGLHRFLLALPPTNPELGAAEMPQSAPHRSVEPRWRSCLVRSRSSTMSATGWRPRSRCASRSRRSAGPARRRSRPCTPRTSSCPRCRTRCARRSTRCSAGRASCSIGRRSITRWCSGRCR